MTKKRAAQTGKHRNHRNFGERLVILIWNVLIGALLVIFVLLYVPYYFIRKLVQRRHGEKGG